MHKNPTGTFSSPALWKIAFPTLFVICNEIIFRYYPEKILWFDKQLKQNKHFWSLGDVGYIDEMMPLYSVRNHNFGSI